MMEFVLLHVSMECISQEHIALIAQVFVARALTHLIALRAHQTTNLMVHVF